MGRPVGSDSGRTRERIVREAMPTFVELGYSKATHEAVAARTGVSRTLLYRYFESKPALFAALLAEIKETLDKRTAEFSSAAGRSGPEQLASFLAAAVQVHTEDPDYSRVLATALVDGLREPEFAGFIESWVTELREIFQTAVLQAAADGQLHPEDDPSTVVNLLVASLWGLGLFGAFMGSAQEAEQAMDLLIRRVLPALFAGDASEADQQ
jgi:AcrR family transcriptional regulator